MVTYNKTPLNWKAPTVQASEAVPFFLKIDDTYFLNIGESYRLQINRTASGTTWTNFS